MSLLPSEPDTSAADEADPRVIGVDSEDADDVLSALTAGTARRLLSELHDEPAPPAELAERADTSLQNAQYHLNKLEDAGAIEVADTMYSEKGREMNVYAPADQPLVIFAGNDEGASGLRAALSRLLGSLGIVALASVAVQVTFGESLPGLPGGGTESAADGGDSGAAPPYARDNQTQTATETEPATATATESDGGEVGAFDAPESESATPEPTVEQEATEIAEETAEPPEPSTTEAVSERATDAADLARETVDAAGSEATDAVASLPPGVLFFLGGLTALVVVAGVWYLTD